MTVSWSTNTPVAHAVIRYPGISQNASRNNKILIPTFVLNMNSSVLPTYIHPVDIGFPTKYRSVIYSKVMFCRVCVFRLGYQ